MKKLQKPLSVLLLMAMIITVVFAVPLEAGAAGQNWLHIIQPEDENGNRIGTIQKENYVGEDWDTYFFASGTRIELTVDPADGYEFISWDVHVQSGGAIDVHFEDYYYYFDVPNIQGHGMHQIVIAANIEKYNPDRKFTTTIEQNHDDTGNTVALDGGSASRDYHEGDTVHINIDWKPETRFHDAISASYYENEEKKSLTLTPSTEENDHAQQYTFVMPRADVTVSCSFEKADYDITYELEYDYPELRPYGGFLEKPYLTIDNTKHEMPYAAGSGKAVTVTCAVKDEDGGLGYCSAITMEYTDEDGNPVSRQLDVDVEKPKRILSSSFEMPASNVKLKLRASYLYNVNADNSAEGYVTADTEYAMAGEKVKLTVTGNGNFAVEDVWVHDLQNHIVPLDGNNEFVMPAAH